MKKLAPRKKKDMETKKHIKKVVPKKAEVAAGPGGCKPLGEV